MEVASLANNKLGYAGHIITIYFLKFWSELYDLEYILILAFIGTNL